MSDVRNILERSRTVAVVGISRDLQKAAGRIPAELKERGFRIIPVNPKSDEIIGEKAYPSLADIPEAVDVVNVFRPAEEAPDIARQAVTSGAKVLWLQSGIRSEEARRIAEEGGLGYIEDRCIAVECSRFDICKSQSDGQQ